MGAPTVYEHFKKKSGLVRFVTEEIEELVLVLMQDIFIVYFSSHCSTALTALSLLDCYIKTVVSILESR